MRLPVFYEECCCHFYLPKVLEIATLKKSKRASGQEAGVIIISIKKYTP